ncbi:MAG: hypothetical protein QOC62_622 [Mycobacterium sp.]|nr:hypothetical protein [Mycobacterium sp.]
MPETTWAATRDGSSMMVPTVSPSPNPYLLMRTISAADVPTIACVRRPALLP